jgi:hypothetical protein
MKKQIVTIALGAAVVLGTATTLLAQNGLPTGGYPPVAGGAAASPLFMTVQLPSGKTVRLRTTKVHGHKVILVPTEMACDAFRVNC